MERKKGKEAAGWNPRMVGIVLCAFFVFGVMTGFSAPGRALTLRFSNFFSDNAVAPASPLMRWLRDAVRSIETQTGIKGAPATELSGMRQGGAIAMVERHDGFYALFSDGELEGPVSPNAEGDLPILSGARALNSRGIELVGYAATMVRAEAELSHLVSEMSVDNDSVAILYLDGVRTEIVIDLDNAPAEIKRAGEVLAKWRGRERMIAALDLTMPGEAVVRLATADAPQNHRHGAVRKVSVRSRGSAGTWRSR
ncbi:MAG: cell division protein FtsQ/DivIB [Candidatus Binataceae bacterium]